MAQSVLRWSCLNPFVFKTVIKWYFTRMFLRHTVWDLPQGLFNEHRHSADWWNRRKTMQSIGLVSRAVVWPVGKTRRVSDNQVDVITDIQALCKKLLLLLFPTGKSTPRTIVCCLAMRYPLPWHYQKSPRTNPRLRCSMNSYSSWVPISVGRICQLRNFHIPQAIILHLLANDFSLFFP